MYMFSACTRGYYKAGLGNTTCQSCPANTTMSPVRASICNCTSGHYRTNEEGPEDSCTGEFSFYSLLVL